MFKEGDTQQSLTDKPVALEFPIILKFRMLIFEEGGKLENPAKNPRSKGETQNSTPIWCRVREFNPGHIGGRRALSPVRHLCSPKRRENLLIHRLMPN